LSITIQHTKEQLSLAYITAIAGLAGLNLGQRSVNDYGVDGYFRSVFIDTRERRRAETGFSIDFQAKASIAWRRRGSDIEYNIERKAYNDMVRRSRSASPLIVILLCLPRVGWYEISEEQLILKHACYWWRLTGGTPISTDRKRILIPSNNLLTPGVLAQMVADEQTAKEAMYDA